MRGVLAKTSLSILIACLAVAWVMPSARRIVQGIASGATTPFLLSWDGVFSRVSDAALTLVGRGREARLRDLEAEVRRLQASLGELAELRRQNRELRAYYALPPVTGWRVVIADVTARDPVTWNRGFRINRGTQDGLALGAVVLSGEAVVGRVVDVQTGSATVRTVGTRDCRLSVVLDGSGVSGILEGTGASEWRSAPVCVVDFLPAAVAVSPGERVRTSGLGGTVPGGLLVGEVAARRGSAEADLQVFQGVYGRLRIQPLADFDRIRVVAIYCPDGGGRRSVGGASP